MSFKSDIKLQRNVLFIGLALMAIKIVAFLLTRSNTILTDTLESLVNILAGSFSLYSLYFASKPSDTSHPYGHGKIEFISGILEGFLINVAGLVMIVKSIYNFFNPEQIAMLDAGIGLALFAGFVNFFMGMRLQKQGDQKHSMSMKSEGAHLKSDGYTSFAMVLGLSVVWITRIYWLDNVIAILMAGFICYMGYGILRKSIAGLMDESDNTVNERVLKVILKDRRPEWIDFHEFRIIRYGRNLHIDCHLVLPFYYTIQQEHKEVCAIEEMVNSGLNQQAEIFIHTDPCTPDFCKNCTMPKCEFRQEEFISRRSD